MPTVADLERLNALTTRLVPLGGAAQGEVIKAEDWNTLVGAIVEIGRVVLGEEREIVPAPHEHPDQVTVGWLEPKLRALIERGPLSDPAMETRLQAIETRVDRLAGRLEALINSLGEVRDRVTEVTTRDLVRQSEITNVRRVVEGLDVGRESVLELRETLGLLQKDVTTAVTIGQRLTVDGQPIDFNNFVERLNRADALAERLTGPTGEVFDAKAFENRLAELTNTLVTQDALDAALDTVRTRIPEDLLGGLENNLRNELLEQMNSSFGTFRTEYDASLSERFAGVDAQISTRIADAVPDITGTVLATVRPETEAALEATRADLQAEFTKNLDTVAGQLKEDYTRGFESLDVNMREIVGSLAARAVEQSLGEVSGRIGRIEENLVPINERLFKLETQIIDLGRLTDLNTGLIDSRTTTLRTDMLTEMDRRDQLQADQFTRQLGTLDTSVNTRINTAITDNNRLLLDQTRTIARETALIEVGTLETRLRADIPVISRDAVTTVVRSEIAAATPTLTRSITNNLRTRPNG